MFRGLSNQDQDRVAAFALIKVACGLVATPIDYTGLGFGGPGPALTWYLLHEDMIEAVAKDVRRVIERHVHRLAKRGVFKDRWV
jgi:hypothetical protein